jgi:hypothetical protein
MAVQPAGARIMILTPIDARFAFCWPLVFGPENPPPWGSQAEFEPPNVKMSLLLLLLLLLL